MMCSRSLPMLCTALLISLPSVLSHDPQFLNTTSSSTSSSSSTLSTTSLSISSSASSILSATSLSSLNSTSSTLSISSNSSTTPKPTITPPPEFCGGCQLIYEVHASVWWPTIYTNYIQTIIYTVNKGSGSTVGSHIEYVNTTALSKIDYGVNFTSVYQLRDGGAVEYTLLNTLSNAPLTTIIQYNEITMNHSNYGNGYALNTISTVTPLVGTPYRNCTNFYYAILNGANTSSLLPGLPSSTGYSYTTVVPFVDGYNMSNVITYGLDLFGTYVASYLNLSAPCTSPLGGGVGTLKVGVTQLTALRTVFAESQNTPPPNPPPASPSPPAPPPTPTPTPPPANPPPSNPRPSNPPPSNPPPSNPPSNPPPSNPPPSNPPPSNSPPSNPPPSNPPPSNPPPSNPPPSNPPSNPPPSNPPPSNPPPSNPPPSNPPSNPPPSNPPPSNPPPSNPPPSNSPPSNPPPSNPPPSNPPPSNPPPSNPPPASNPPAANPPSSNSPSSNPPSNDSGQSPASPGNSGDKPPSSLASIPGVVVPANVAPTLTTTLVSVITDTSGKVTTVPVATLIIGPSFTSTLAPGSNVPTSTRTSFTVLTDASGKVTTIPVATLVIGSSFTSTLQSTGSGSEILPGVSTTKGSSPATTTFAEATGSASRRSAQDLIWAAGLGLVGITFINVFL